jgi:serine/threonine protein kinase
MLDHFQFRQFYVIVFEALDVNLYKHIKSPKFKGMSKSEIRSIALQLLKGLLHLKKIGVVHCDLKPENVLFSDPSK